MQLNTLHDLLYAEINDLYDAERRISELLPKMQGAATHPDLKQAFANHLDETLEQRRRLDEVYAKLGKSYDGETCEATQGLVKEAQAVIDASGDPAVRDAALISAAQRVEHYEIAGYGTARTLARQLELLDVADLLQKTLDEEYEADGKLDTLAEGGLFSSGINAEAAHQ
ncbi:MAG: ferritin-like domain-containing protein [Chthoniobacterales bacterium]